MSNKGPIIGLFIFWMFFMPACNGNAGTAPWPMFGHDARHTGRSEYVEKGFDLLFRSPVVGGYGNLDPEFYANSTPTSPIAIGADGIIYASTGQFADVPIGLKAIYPGSELVIDSNNRVKWTYNTYGYSDPNAPYFHSCPAIGSDGTVYVGADDGFFYALDPNSELTDANQLKNYKWKFETKGKIRSSPVIGSDGTIYVGSDDGYLYAIDPANGSSKWWSAGANPPRAGYRVGSPIRSSPAIGYDGTIYVGSDDKRLHAVNPNGSGKWSYLTGDMVRSSPAIGSDGTIYVGSYDSYLHAVNPNGTLKWKYKTDDAVESSPAIGPKGTIYVGSNDGYLHAIDPLHGKRVWRYAEDPRFVSPIKTSAAIDANGTIIFVSGNIYFLYPDGTLKWTSASGLMSMELPCSPAIAANGAVYINGSWIFSFRLEELVPGKTLGQVVFYGSIRDMATDAVMMTGDVPKVVIAGQTDSKPNLDWDTDIGPSKDIRRGGHYFLIKRRLTEKENGPYPIIVSGEGYQTLNFDVAIQGGDAVRVDLLVPTTGALSLTREAFKPAGVGQEYQDRAWVAGGTYPYVFSFTGTLPPGCALNTATGAITGTPTTAGSYTLGIKVKDHQNQETPSHEYKIYVMPADYWGDIDGDSRLTIGDAILGLKVLSRMQDAATLNPAEVTAGKLSLQNIIYIIQSLAGLR